jgi:hypothetical protein
LRRLAAALLPQALRFLTFLCFAAFVCFIGLFVSPLLRYFASLHDASFFCFVAHGRHCPAFGCNSTKLCHAAPLPCGVFRHSPRRQVP